MKSPSGGFVPSMRVVLPVLLALLLVTVAAGADDKRVALVIGNGAYDTPTVTPLTNPPNDARDVAATLAEIGFDVRTVIDGTREEMGAALDGFALDLRDAEVGLFYFAGHGVQVDGTNYLIPVDADLPNAGVVHWRTLAADEVLASMEDAGARLNLFFLDACRDNPLPQVSRSLHRGLAPVSRRPPETMIVYATGANDVASDGLGRNSPFTQAFLNHVGTPGLDVYDLYRNVSREVREATGGEQRPEQFGNVTDRVSLVAPDEAPAARPAFEIERTLGSIRVTVETEGTVYLDGERIGALDAGQTATLSDVSTGARRLEVRYGDGEREEETVRVRTDTRATVAFTYVEAPERDAVNSVGMEFVAVEGGTFRMGRTDGHENERPVRRVTLTGFEMATTPVTQGQWQAVTGTSIHEQRDLAHPNWNLFGKGENNPVYFVNWYDAIAYANRLSIAEGLTPVYSIGGSTDPDDWGEPPEENDDAWDAAEMDRSADGYRLPTEAEWEYAARGGTESRGYEYAGSDEVDEVAWYFGNSDDSTHPVGAKAANELGLYDMSGNVWEWCWDWYDDYSTHTESDPMGPSSGEHRVRRGGWAGSIAMQTRSSRRLSEAPERRIHVGGDGSYGFRLVRAPVQ